MKTLMFVLMTLTPFCMVFSQQEEPETMRYLLENGIQVSGFGGMMVSFGEVEDDFAVFSGGGGALLINQRYFLGGFGEGLATSHKRDNLRIDGQDLSDVKTSLGYGGLWTGYIFKPNDLIHVQSSVKIAAGELALTDSFKDVYDNLYDDLVFVAIPSIGVQMNILPWFRVSLDAGYRHIGNVENKTEEITGQAVFDAKDYRGLHTTIGLMFGGF